MRLKPSLSVRPSRRRRTGPGAGCLPAATRLPGPSRAVSCHRHRRRRMAGHPPALERGEAPKPQGSRRPRGTATLRTAYNSLPSSGRRSPRASSRVHGITDFVVATPQGDVPISSDLAQGSGALEHAVPHRPAGGRARLVGLLAGGGRSTAWLSDRPARPPARVSPASACPGFLGSSGRRTPTPGCSADDDGAARPGDGPRRGQRRKDTISSSSTSAATDIVSHFDWKYFEPEEFQASIRGVWRRNATGCRGSTRRWTRRSAASSPRRRGGERPSPLGPWLPRRPGARTSRRRWTWTPSSSGWAICPPGWSGRFFPDACVHLCDAGLPAHQGCCASLSPAGSQGGGSVRRSATGSASGSRPISPRSPTPGGSRSSRLRDAHPRRGEEGDLVAVVHLASHAGATSRRPALPACAPQPEPDLRNSYALHPRHLHRRGPGRRSAGGPRGNPCP